MSTEAALFTAHDSQSAKFVAVPERAVRHLLGRASPWRVCGQAPDLPAMPARLAERVFSWVNPETRRVAVARATDLGLLPNDATSFAGLFGLDGADGDQRDAVGRVVLDEGILGRLPESVRPLFLQSL